MTVRLALRLQRFARDHDQLARRPLRFARRTVSVLLHRARVLSGRALPPRVVVAERPVEGEPLQPGPAVVVRVADRAAGERWLAGQTETAASLGPAAGARFLLHLAGDPGRLPATHLEALLMVAAAGDLEWAVAGWSAPAGGRFGPSGDLARDPEVAGSSLALLRLPAPSCRQRSAVLGRAVPHVVSPARLAGTEAVAVEGAALSGPCHLRPGTRPGTVVSHRVTEVDGMLAALPETPGQRTVLFLLPYLAVGGAERLLFDLVEGLGRRCRTLVVTSEPHLERLGQTVDRARELTPHVYTLGDWLERPAHPGALRHLLRRYRVETLVSWNGTTLFFGHLRALRRRFPHLRVASQLYNHRGGWISHTSSAVVRDVDVHLAVNDRIAGALVERGVPRDRVVTVHHGVRLPPPAESDPGRAARRRERRAELGLGDDAVVVGTFVRLHPQKRPLDVVAVARRLAGRGVRFLLVGGGPLEEEVDRELAERPCPNLTRVPMRPGVEDLYDAVDLCLLTSEYEGLPVFLLDGLARGIPCVATAVGEVPELLAEGGGVLVRRPGDIASLAAGVEALLGEGVRAREGTRGRDTVARRFSWERYVKRYADVLLP